MVSAVEAKEIAGNHVDQIVGGPEAGYLVSETISYVESHDVEVEVWRGPDERNDPAIYVVKVDADGTIADSHWK